MTTLSRLRTWQWNGMPELPVAGSWLPPVDITEDKESVVVAVEMPGVKPEDIEVSLENDLLTIRGEKAQRRFERAFTVPNTVDVERIAARYEHGVLTISLPKAERAKPRQIKVNIE